MTGASVKAFYATRHLAVRVFLTALLQPFRFKTKLREPERHFHADQRNREQEERERSYQRRLAEPAALLRSLAREACLQAQEVR
jgi:hypothetical protein